MVEKPSAYHLWPTRAAYEAYLARWSRLAARAWAARGSKPGPAAAR